LPNFTVRPFVHLIVSAIHPLHRTVHAVISAICANFPADAIVITINVPSIVAVNVASFVPVDVTDIHLTVHDAGVGPIAICVGRPVIDYILAAAVVVVTIIAQNECSVGSRVRPTAGIVKIHGAATRIPWAVIIVAVAVFDTTGEQETANKCWEYEQ
jgi:hypothetical protein